MKKFMLITLGTGNGVENGIAKSISANKPDGIIFIKTHEGVKRQMPELVAQALQNLYKGDMPEVYQTDVVLQDEANVKEAYRVTLQSIEFVREHGYGLDEIVLDFTSGTKAMTVGAALAAFLTGCRTMVYIGGFQRDATTGRVITGSEEVITFTLNDLPESYAPQAEVLEKMFTTDPHEINLIYP